MTETDAADIPGGGTQCPGRKAGEKGAGMYKGWVKNPPAEVIPAHELLELIQVENCGIGKELNGICCSSTSNGSNRVERACSASREHRFQEFWRETRLAFRLGPGVMIVFAILGNTLVINRCLRVLRYCRIRMHEYTFCNIVLASLHCFRGTHRTEKGRTSYRHYCDAPRPDLYWQEAGKLVYIY